jgi:epoxyqueuosine reductase
MSETLQGTIRFDNAGRSGFRPAGNLCYSGVMAVEGSIKQRILDLSRELGFSDCGFAAAGELGWEWRTFSSWLKRGGHASMGWLERTAELRRSPSHEKFFPGARTVIMFALAYGHRTPPEGTLARALAAYARGRDYHEEVRRRLEHVAGAVASWRPAFKSRVFVDSAPVMEKAWAQRCGVGWVGRSGLVVTKRSGTLVVLGGMVTTMELEPDTPARDGCGECSACVDACPTGALGPDRTVTADRCLAYATTEAREIEDAALSALAAGRTCFGCDLCQQACPLNSGVEPGDRALQPLDVWQTLRPEDEKLLRGTTMERLGPERFMQNVRCYLDT